MALVRGIEAPGCLGGGGFFIFLKRNFFLTDSIRVNNNGRTQRCSPNEGHCSPQMQKPFFLLVRSSKIMPGHNGGRGQSYRCPVAAPGVRSFVRGAPRNHPGAPPPHYILLITPEALAFVIIPSHSRFIRNILIAFHGKLKKMFLLLLALWEYEKIDFILHFPLKFKGEAGKLSRFSQFCLSLSLPLPPPPLSLFQPSRMRSD